MSIKKLHGSSVTNFTLEDFSARGGYNIITGPDIDVLFDACKYVQSDDIRKAATRFEVLQSEKVNEPGINLRLGAVPTRRWKILGLQNTVGKPHLFHVSGVCEVDLKYRDHKDKKWKYEAKVFHAQYNVEEHTGVIVFFDRSSSGGDGSRQMTFCDLSQDTYD